MVAMWVRAYDSYHKRIGIAEAYLILLKDCTAEPRIAARYGVVVAGENMIEIVQSLLFGWLGILGAFLRIAHYHNMLTFLTKEVFLTMCCCYG